MKTIIINNHSIYRLISYFGLVCHVNTQENTLKVVAVTGQNETKFKRSENFGKVQRVDSVLPVQIILRHQAALSRELSVCMCTHMYHFYWVQRVHV